MIKPYLNAAIRQAEERSKILKGKITKPLQAPELVALHQTCHNRIDRIIAELELLRTDPNVLRDELIQERIRLFRRTLADLSFLETTAIVALARAHEDDIALSRLVFQIHKEINYPLTPPMVTCLSREYFCINVLFRLLEVPLAESDFLLHLPDLYHEIAHLLIVERNNPVIVPYQTEYGKFLALVTRHFDTERTINLKSTGPKEYFNDALDHFEFFWIRSWANEIFCDLFAIYTLGPAYAWSHFHFTAGHDVDPCDVRMPGFMTHPPDHARMEVMLIGLDLIGYTKIAAEIQKKWNALLMATGVKQGSLYRRACPHELLEHAATLALQGTKNVGCRVAQAGTSGPVFDLLNSAWDKFWTTPDDYHAWERTAIAKIKQFG